MNDFLWGALACASTFIGVFFLRFWRVSHERILLYFALAFWMLALNWIGLAVLQPPSESRAYFYLLRLAAFTLIVVGIADKNRRARR